MVVDKPFFAFRLLIFGLLVLGAALLFLGFVPKDRAWIVLAGFLVGKFGSKVG